ncbi:MAG: hypothetical protein EOO40_08605 [Deltaproteobacteria bacterium]|nr:MAG: hypothetical protein EOO40_08605 [Deltaproteobacteria bacterium]
MVTQSVRALRRKTAWCYQDSLTICGTTIPPNQAQPAFFAEKYGVVFPAALCARGSLPTFTTELQLDGPAVGAKYIGKTNCPSFAASVLSHHYNNRDFAGARPATGPLFATCSAPI